MRSLILLVVLLASQTVFSQVRRITPAEARTRVERSTTYQEIMAVRNSGREITRDARLMEKVNRMIELNMRDVLPLSADGRGKLVKLINVSPTDVLTQVLHLTSVVKDASTPAATRESARKALDLMIKSAHTVNSLAVNSAQARAQELLVTKIIELSNKISNLSFGTASRDFVSKYERALIEGKTVDEAIRIASNGKFTERDLRECT